MTDADDIDAMAAEYVLGTLTAAERTAVSARRLREPALDRAIELWELRLSPLNDAIPPVAPPPALRPRVLAQIDGMAFTPELSGNVIAIDALQRRLARWRTAAIAASAIAASLAGLIVVRATAPPQALPSSYVAVLQKDAQSPAFLMTVNLATRTFTVRAVAAEAHAGKSYELWLVHEKLGAPRSLGLLAADSFSNSPKLAAFSRGEIEGATYAVSVEPAGGSPTGAPTGPVVYAGKLVQAQP